MQSSPEEDELGWELVQRLHVPYANWTLAQLRAECQERELEVCGRMDRKRTFIIPLVRDDLERIRSLSADSRRQEEQEPTEQLPQEEDERMGPPEPPEGQTLLGWARRVLFIAFVCLVVFCVYQICCLFISIVEGLPGGLCRPALFLCQTFPLCSRHYMHWCRNVQTPLARALESQSVGDDVFVTTACIFKDLRTVKMFVDVNLPYLEPPPKAAVEWDWKNNVKLHPGSMQGIRDVIKAMKEYKYVYEGDIQSISPTLARLDNAIADVEANFRALSRSLDQDVISATVLSDTLRQFAKADGILDKLNDQLSKLRMALQPTRNALDQVSQAMLALDVNHVLKAELDSASAIEVYSDGPASDAAMRISACIASAGAVHWGRSMLMASFPSLLALGFQSPTPAILVAVGCMYHMMGVIDANAQKQVRTAGRGNTIGSHQVKLFSKRLTYISEVRDEISSRMKVLEEADWKIQQLRRSLKSHASVLSSEDLQYDIIRHSVATFFGRLAGGPLRSQIENVADTYTGLAIITQPQGSTSIDRHRVPWQHLAPA
eukprot:TRINITY_DN36466_c0_g1_i1.p1 TRINITY_DN36466_c0_g1~~TRINITY_DN36466_c0_g1_i1.p1  ORF type:complete len:547 (-),score=35.20 TRINITY_DN36466_c0_g1_i1:272-1912(-)